jgi:hypothetical protein
LLSLDVDIFSLFGLCNCPVPKNKGIFQSSGHTAFWP